MKIRWETCINQKNANSVQIPSPKEIRNNVLRVNEEPHLRTRILIGVLVSQWETEQLSKNSCPYAGETQDCVFWHDKKNTVLFQELLKTQQEK